VGYAYGRPELIAPAPLPDIGARVALALQALRFRLRARIRAVLPAAPAQSLRQ